MRCSARKYVLRILALAAQIDRVELSHTISTGSTGPQAMSPMLNLAVLFLPITHRAAAAGQRAANRGRA